MFLLVGSMFLIAGSASAQTKEEHSSLLRFPRKTLVSAALFPSFYLNTETLLSRNITLKNEIGIPWNIYKSSDRTSFVYQITYTGSLNWYYNFSRRLKKEKNIQGFSGNYFALFSRAGVFHPYLLKYDIPWSEFMKHGLSFGVMYGMQRTFGKKQRGFYDLGAGISYTPYGKSKFLPELKARIGLRLTKISE